MLKLKEKIAVFQLQNTGFDLSLMSTLPHRVNVHLWENWWLQQPGLNGSAAASVFFQQKQAEKCINMLLKIKLIKTSYSCSEI